MVKFLMSQLLPSHPTPCLLSLSFVRKQTRLSTQNKINGMFSTFCLISLCKGEVLGLKYQERLGIYLSDSTPQCVQVWKINIKVKKYEEKTQFSALLYYTAHRISLTLLCKDTSRHSSSRFLYINSLYLLMYISKASFLMPRRCKR